VLFLAQVPTILKQYNLHHHCCHLLVLLVVGVLLRLHQLEEVERPRRVSPMGWVDQRKDNDGFLRDADQLCPGFIIDGFGKGVISGEKYTV